MRLTIAYSKVKTRNLVLINNDTYQRETLSERPIWQPLSNILLREMNIAVIKQSTRSLFKKLYYHSPLRFYIS